VYTHGQATIRRKRSGGTSVVDGRTLHLSEAVRVCIPKKFAGTSTTGRGPLQAECMRRRHATAAWSISNRCGMK